MSVHFLLLQIVIIDDTFNYNEVDVNSSCSPQLNGLGNTYSVASADIQRSYSHLFFIPPRNGASRVYISEARTRFYYELQVTTDSKSFPKYAFSTVNFDLT